MIRICLAKEKKATNRMKVQFYLTFSERTSLFLGLGRGRLEDAAGGHQVLDVLTQHLVFRLQLQVLYLDRVHPG